MTSNVVTWTLSSNVSWLSFEPATGDKSATVVVTVAEDGEGEQGVITLSAEGLESVTCKVTRTDIMDISIADFLAAEVSDKPYRITAKIESIVKEEYGNIYVQDATGRVYVYGLTATLVSKNDKSFASLGLREGDIITFVGTRGRYDGAKVEDQKEEVLNAYLEVSYKSTDVTISEFLTKEVASKYLESPYYRLTGVVKEIVKEEYGNLYLKEADSDTYVFVYGVTKAPVAKNNKSFVELGVKVGDKLTIVGQRGQYANSKVEDQKEQVANAYFISVESGDTPIPPVEDVLTVENALIEVEADAVSATFAVKSNLDWIVTKSEGDWVTSFTESGSKDGTIEVNFAANDGEARTAKFAVKGGEKTVELTLTQKATTGEPVIPVYASLAELVAAGEPTEEGTNVTVTLTNEEIVEFYVAGGGKYTNGVFLMVGERKIEIYCKDTPSDWKVGGTISGTLTNCKWAQFKGTWELCPNDYSELTYTAPIEACAAPTISIDAAGVVTITCETAGAKIYYTVGESPADPTDADTEYAAPVTLTNGQIIKAIAYAEGHAPSSIVSDMFTSGVKPNDGSLERPYTAAEAIAVIDGGTGLTDKHVKGVITKVTSFNGTYGSLVYDIESGDATLNIYGGLDLGNAKFYGTEDLKVGEEVIVFGNLTKFNSTYEMDKNNYLISVDGKTEIYRGLELSGQKKSFTVGDTFEFGGKVLQVWRGKDDVDVTATAVFSGYDMSAEGTQTVTVTVGAETAIYEIKVKAAGTVTDYSSVFTSNVTYSFSEKVKIGDTSYDCFRVGTSKAGSSVSFKVPAGTKRLCLHVVGWGTENGKIHKIVTNVGAISSNTITTTADSGVKGNSPFTLSNADFSDEKYYFEFTLTDVTEEATITISADSGKQRGVYFGINAE